MIGHHADSLPELLGPFGFSETEALIYAFLLKQGPATGYAVGQGIGKPTANVYKAMSSLAAKGALTVVEGGVRLCQAVPPEELLARMERTFVERKALALDHLRQIRAEAGDDRIYQLKDPAQVLARARTMLGRARQIALLDIFPGPFQALEAELRQALDRGVRVAVQTYAPATLPGADLVRNELDPTILENWPGQQLSLVVDASEYLIALLSPDGTRVHQAIWSASPFLACMQHNHLACELMLTAAPDPGPLKEISLLRADPPGLKALRERLEPTGL